MLPIMSGPEPGDLVEVIVKDGKYVGILLPSQQLVDEDKILLKLENGYNRGFNKSDVKSINLLEKHEKSDNLAEEDVFNPKLPTVSVLSTGGTISSKIDYRTGGVAASLTAADLLHALPELKGKVNLKPKSIMNVMSEDMTPKHWLKMAEEVAYELNTDVSGVVVTHGTDTMHYSAAALSFLLNSTPKPVVLTGAQRSIDRGSSDGYMNLSCAIWLSTSDYAGVSLVMHSKVDDDTCIAHNGVRVRKMHTSKRDAFQSINAKPFAKITPTGKVEFTTTTKKRGQGQVLLDGGFEEKVGFIKAYPGMPIDILDYYINKGYKGVVFEGTALGHLPVTDKDYSLLPAIERAINEGVILAMTTQCLYGRVHPNVYSNLRELSTRGVVFCGDMLPETCYVKLMWVLGKSQDPGQVKDLLLTNVCGEISDKSVIDDKLTPFD
jgi:glutamyl-tRNA(Gln) amidotransferase subunit D